MKKEIVFILGSLDKGGVERVITTLANYFVSNYKVTIITLLSDKQLYKINDSITVIHLFKKDEKRLFKLPIWLYKLNKIFKTIDNNNSIIISFVARINIVVLLANIFSKIPIIVSERNDPKNDGRTITINIFTHLLYRLANKIVFQTNYAKLLFSKAIQDKGVIIYNPITINVFKEPLKEQKTIVNVGRLVTQKNQQLLIRAFKQINLQYPEYVLHIYGDGPLKDKLKQLISKLELENKVILKGNVDDIHNAYKNATMFVLSSNFEGQSNSLLESMAMGIPCISTNIPGINEIVNSTNCKLVEKENKTQLIKAMIKLIDNKSIRDTLRENGKKIIKNHDAKTILLIWEHLIETTIIKK